MSHSKSKNFTSIVFESLGWPLIWGLAATFTFYFLVSRGIVQSELVSRYFAGHPVEYIETALFFIGVVALLMKATDLAYQFRVVPKTKLAAPLSAGEPPSKAEELIATLTALPRRMQETYLVRRLSNALRYVQQSDSADDVDEQLRYLSEVDAERSHDGYSLVRMIIWATPMLGFLGTVIGITLALGDLSPEALVNAPKEAMQGLLAGLSIAFDTTALALSLSIVLMFLQYVVREVETQLLTVVDRRVEDELVGRFQIPGSATDPNVGAIKRMSEDVLKSVDELTERQAEIWSTALSATQRQWSDALQNTSTSVQSNLQTLLSEAMAAHAEALTVAEQNAVQRGADRWDDIRRGMEQQASLLGAQLEAISQQGDLMLRVLDATGEVQNLEAALNQNLSALAGAKNFEDTVMSLSAAIQLLTSRVGLGSNELSIADAQKGRAA